MTIQCPKCKAENPDTSSYCADCGTQLSPLKDLPVQTKTLVTPPQELSRGTTIAGRYEIIERLGTGGMGSVYRVEDKKIHEDVALKLIKPEIAADKKTIERFNNELKIARKIAHRNVCKMYDIGESEGTHFITMEYVPGEDLKSFMRRAKQLSIPTVLSIAKQICGGLDEAHKLGIVHRDLKPSNIMIDKAGNARIMDFGIARSVKGEALTGDNVIIGTPDYMSPEQVEGKEIDQRSDIYSLGIVLFEMLTGERPFKGDTSLSVAMKHKSESPPNPKWLNDQIPDGLSRLVLICLEKDKEKRYQSAEELLSALKTLDEKKIQVTDKEEQKKSIAVLPFTNMSADPEQEYFCDGMTEEITSDLSKVQNLLVISRNSAMTYKGTKKKTQEIGRELNVQYILEGSVRKAGNNLRITAQLINAEDDVHLWSEKYSGTIDDVFEIQEIVSRSIVEALELKLTPDEKRKMAERPIENVVAYESYLRANEEILRFTEESINRAIRYLQNSIEIVGDNALLYSGLAYAYFSLVNIGIKQDDYLMEAEKYVKIALQLDPNFPNAHSIFGYLCLWRGKVIQAVTHYRKALSINPNESYALVGISAIYEMAGKITAAVPYSERLMQVDPLSLPAIWIQGGLHFYNGEFSRALSPWQRLYEQYPENPYALFTYSLILTYNDETAKAISIIDRNEKINPNTALTRLGLILKYAVIGNKKKALQEMTPELQKTCQRDGTYSHHLAGFFSLLNEKEEALKWLEVAINAGFINYSLLLKQDPFLENIRGEPRFKKLMERVKHEWENFEV